MELEAGFWVVFAYISLNIVYLAWQRGRPPSLVTEPSGNDYDTFTLVEHGYNFQHRVGSSVSTGSLFETANF